MSRRGENIYKRKDGRWEGRYPKSHRNGKIQYGYVYAKTYREVKSKLGALAFSVNQKDTSCIISQSCVENKIQEEKIHCNLKEQQRESFASVAEEWLDALEPQLKESSIVRYRNILKLYLLPEFGERNIVELTRTEVMDFKSRLLRCGGKKQQGLSPKTVTCVLSVLKSIFVYAVRVKGYPVADVRGIAVKKFQKPMRILSRQEQKRLSEYLGRDLTFCNLGILVCLYMGLRIGEICALKWADISFEEQYLYVHQTMQRIQRNTVEGRKTEIVISTPKSDCSIRRIPIPDEIFQFLQKVRRPDDTYFLTGLTQRYLEPRTMQYRFKRVIENCGIAEANFHALRHTFATRCIELGFDVKSLSEVLGHASVNITLNRYVHPSMDLKQKNMNLLSVLLSAPESK